MSLQEDLLDKYFFVQENCLQVGGVPFEHFVSTYPTPFFLYDMGVIRKKVKMLRKELPDYDIYYAIKSNPSLPLISLFQEQGCGFNAATAGEIEKASHANVDLQRLILAGAGKIREDIVAAIRCGVEEIHIDSFRELELLKKLAVEFDQKIQVGLRCNPGTNQGEREAVFPAKPQAYGLDENDLEEAIFQIQSCPNLNFSTLHFYFGTQCLDQEYMFNAYSHTFQTVERLVNSTGKPIRNIDFGGGFGVPYFPREKEFSIKKFGQSILPMIERIRQNPLLVKTRFIVEPGRYLTAESGLYVVRVLDIKSSYGKTFLITDGGIHHHLAATGNLGHVLRKNFPVIFPSRLGQEEQITVDIVGRQSTALDTLARNIELPSIQIGDVIVFMQSGAYGLSASPVYFRSHQLPNEIFVDNGIEQVVKYE